MPTYTIKKKPSVGAIIGHTFLVFVTGGIWGVVLLVRMALK